MSEEIDTTRRKAIGVVGAIGLASLTAGTAKEAKAANSCLEAPKCNTICAYGGTPKANGTQECLCNDNPAYTYADVCYTGSYGDVKDLPTRAGSPSDGGPANNSELWEGYGVRLNQIETTTDAKVPVVSGSNIDYVFKSEIGSAPNVGAKTFSVSKVGYSFSVSRDAVGRLTGVFASYDANAVNCINCANCKNCNCCNCTNCTNCCDCKDCNCNCNCCNCGDDTGCFIRATLYTKDGYKRVEDIRVGDVLLGNDGEHRVLAIAKNIIGESRFAIRPKRDEETVLTNDHVINIDDVPVSYDFNSLRLNLATIESDGVTGTYNYQGLLETAYVDKDLFDVVDLPKSNTTYTFIVDKGHWGETVGGLAVLLATVQQEGEAK